MARVYPVHSAKMKKGTPTGPLFYLCRELSGRRTRMRVRPKRRERLGTHEVRPKGDGQDGPSLSRPKSPRSSLW
jgi:hypothetical protein